MQRYSEFRPTNFDKRGINLPDRRNWLVIPVAHSRDSDTLAESNFRVTEQLLGKLDPEGGDHEIHRFGHWACGWFEIILVKPNTDCAAEGAIIEGLLADHPILNESDYSERENALDINYN